MEEKPRDEKGRFKVTNGNQRYKAVQRSGKRIQLHVLIWEEYYNKKLPTGWCVHHKNGNKKDNRIENLEAMPIPKHNKIHFEDYYKNNDVWNKGKKCPGISKSLMGHKISKEQIKKLQCSWFNKFLDSNIKIWGLKDKGLTPSQISKELNLTVSQVNHRGKGFKKVIDVSSGRLK